MQNNTTYSGYLEEQVFIVDYHPILITCGVMVCIANSLVITLFLTQASLRSSANYLLFSLSVSDLAVGVLGIPINIACEMLSGWTTCLSSYVLNRFIAMSTVYHILWITMEKYTAIVYPFWHKTHFDRAKVRNICVCIWFSSVLLSALELSWLTQHDDPNEYYSEDLDRKVFSYNIFIFAGAFVLPITVMVFAHASIFLRILRQHSDEFLRKHDQGQATHPRVPRNFKTAMVFFAILLVFTLGWFWWFFCIIYFSILKQDYKNELVPFTLFKLLTALRYCTSFINPLLYTFFKRDFNKALRKLTNRSRLTPVQRQGSRSTRVVS